MGMPFVILKVSYTAYHAKEGQHKSLVDTFLGALKRLGELVRKHGTNSNNMGQKMLERDLTSIVRNNENPVLKAKNFEGLLRQMENSEVFAPKSLLSMMYQVTYFGALCDSSEARKALYKLD